MSEELLAEVHLARMSDRTLARLLEGHARRVAEGHMDHLPRMRELLAEAEYRVAS